MKKIIRMDNGIFPRNIWIFVGCSEEEITKEISKYIDLTKHDYKKFVTDSHARTFNFINGTNVIVLKKLDISYLPMLVHELAHCVQNLVNARILNKEITMPDETLPYLLEHWMAQIVVAMNDKKYDRFYNK